MLISIPHVSTPFGASDLHTAGVSTSVSVGVVSGVLQVPGLMTCVTYEETV